MADIRHSIEIAAPSGRVESLVSTAEGLSAWWAADVVVASNSDAIDLGFFDRATTYRLRARHEDRPFRWNCESGGEWSGTSIVFRPRESEKLIRLEFQHEGWMAETPYFVSCNTVWGHLMFRLKEVAEGGGSRPLFTRSGME